jgi:hypothetical protein
LHIAEIVRLRYDQRSRDYATRRTSRGTSRPAIIRCRKRYLAREISTLSAPTTSRSPLDGL